MSLGAEHGVENQGYRSIVINDGVLSITNEAAETLLVLRPAPKGKEEALLEPLGSVIMANYVILTTLAPTPFRHTICPSANLSFFLFPKNQLKALPSATLTNVTLHYCGTGSSRRGIYGGRGKVQEGFVDERKAE